MGTPLRVLMVEDSQTDAFLLKYELEAGGYDLTLERVETWEAMKAAMERAEWDLVIADYDLPQFTGMAALRLLKEKGPDLPFIVVSGRIGEETAVMMMRAGAHDYVMKNNLVRLVPAVERELREAKARRERRRTEKALEETEAMYRRIVETANEGIWVINDKSQTTFVNRRMAEFLGFTVAEMLGQPATAFMFEKDLAGHRERMESRRVGQESHYEQKFRRKDGGGCWLYVSATPLRDAEDRFAGSFGMLTDITERKQAEDALQENRNLLNAVIEGTGDAVYVKDIKGQYILFNSAAARAVDKPADEVIGKDDTFLFPPAEAKRMREEDRAVMEGRKVCTYEETVTTASGAETTYLSTKGPLIDGQGNLIGIFGIARDVTERKRSEAALRESEERYRQVVEDQTEVISRFLPDGTFVFVNDIYCRFFGQSREELLGRKWFPVAHPDDLEAIQARLRTLSAANSVVVVENRVFSGKGELRWMQFVNRGIFNEKGSLCEIQCVGRDITDRKEAEILLQKSQAELAHAWRVAAVGEMASSLAHELNQPLCSIQSHAEACLKLITSGKNKEEEIMAATGEIVIQAHRAGNIVRQVKDFTRKSEPHRAAADLNAIIQNAARLAEPSIKNAGIAAESRLSNQVSSVFADQIQIEQVVLNLIQNAVDAMSENGAEGRKLSIETELVDEKNRDQVRVLVRDNGKGIREENMPRVLESFFTTKPEGLGMGLPICRSIIENHGGRLWFYPNSDRGMTFCFTLPVVEAGYDNKKGVEE